MPRAYLDNEGVSHFTRPSKSTTNLAEGTFCQKIKADIHPSALESVEFISCLACIAYDIALRNIVRELASMSERLRTEGWPVAPPKPSGRRYR